MQSAWSSARGTPSRLLRGLLAWGEQCLRRWHARLAPKPPPCGENASLSELKEENQRLRRELRRAELERDILKKATAYFAKESL